MYWNNLLPGLAILMCLNSSEWLGESDMIEVVHTSQKIHNLQTVNLFCQCERPQSCVPYRIIALCANG